MRLNTCRLCDDYMSQDLVKYGARHYAHYKCYLKAGKPLSILPSWQIAQFPFFLLKEYGLIDEVNKILAARGHKLENFI